MSTPTKSPVAATAGSPSDGDRSQSPSRIRNLVERSSTFINKRRESFRRKRQDNDTIGQGSSSSPSSSSRPRSPRGGGQQDGQQQQEQGNIVSRVMSKTVAAMKWTPISPSTVLGYLPLVILILLIVLSSIGLWTILQATVLRDW